MILIQLNELHLLPLILATCALISSLGHLFTIKICEWQAWLSATIYLTNVSLTMIRQTMYLSVNSTLHLSICLLLFDLILRVHLLYSLFLLMIKTNKLQHYDRLNSTLIWQDLDVELSNEINGSILHFTCSLLQSIAILYSMALLKSRSQSHSSPFLSSHSDDNQFARTINLLNRTENDEQIKIDLNSFPIINSSININMENIQTKKSVINCL